MIGHIRIRNGLFAKDRAFEYHTGYVTNVSGTHTTKTSYNKQRKDIDVRNIYTSDVTMVDIETNRERTMFLPFRTHLKGGDFATIIYANSDKKGMVEPIAIYNHEVDECNFDASKEDYIGFKLLGYGKTKRAFAWLLRVFEYLVAFALSFIVGFLFTKEPDIIAGIIAFILTPFIWYIVGFFTNIFFPSHYGAKRAFAAFDKNILKFCQKEREKTRVIRQKMAAAQNPMNQINQAQQQMNGFGIGPNPSHQQAPQQNNSGYKSMF